MKVNIFIVTHKRAQIISTHRHVKGCVAVVSSDQADEYHKYNPGLELLVHPPVVGKAAKLQWVLDQKISNPFFLDDDISAIGRTFVNPKNTNKLGKITPELIREIIVETAHLSKECGAYLYGFPNQLKPMYYHFNQPFKVKGFMPGCCFGILDGSKLFYDKKIVLLDDMFISLLNVYYHRYCFRNERYAFQFGPMFTTAGGQAEFRNLKTEAIETQILKDMFGRDIFGKQKDGSAFFERHFNLPF